MCRKWAAITIIIVSICFYSDGFGSNISSGNSLEQNESAYFQSNISDLNIYLELAASNNAGLKAAFQNWKEALSVVPQSEALSDPKFTFSYFIEEIETKVGPQREKIGIVQSFPWFGKLDARKDSAAALAEAARYEFENIKLGLYYQIKKTYFEYAYAATSLVIAKENQELVKHYEAIARARYQTSTAAHPDVIRSQIELSIIDDVIKSLNSLQEPLVSELKAAMNYNGDNSGLQFDWPDRVAPFEYEVDRDEIMSNIVASPAVSVMKQKLDAAKAGEILAAKSNYPDFTVGVDWIVIDEPDNEVKDAGKDALAVMFGLNIPLWGSKNKAVRQQAAARTRRAESSEIQEINDRISKADKLLYDISEAKRKMKLYGSTLGQKADDLIITSETAYRSGTLSFLSLIDAQRLRLKYKLNYERAVVDYMQKIAELEMLSGGLLKTKELEQTE